MDFRLERDEERMVRVPEADSTIALSITVMQGATKRVTWEREGGKGVREGVLGEANVFDFGVSNC